MSNTKLEHYGLYGLFDFLRSPEAIERSDARKAARNDYRRAAGDDRRETRLETGSIRRERRVIKQENRNTQIINNNETSFGGSIGGLISSLFPKNDTYSTMDSAIPSRPMFDENGNIDEPKTLNAGGWILGVLVVSAIGGAVYFKNKSIDKVEPKKTK